MPTSPPHRWLRNMLENTALQTEVKAEKAPNMLVRVAPTLAVVSVLGMSGAANAAAISRPSRARGLKPL